MNGLIGWFKDTRLAWGLWVVFALAIGVNTAMKQDDVLTLESEHVVGRILRQDDTGALVRVKARGGTEERWIAAERIAIVAPLGDRSVTGNYRLGAEHWHTKRAMYTEGPHGFLYLPQAAMIFLPFEVLPALAGEVLWRWAGIGAYAAGVWALCRLIAGYSGAGRPVRLAGVFTIATLLAIPAALGSAQNGQTNLALGGLFALSAVSASGRRWWWTTLWLMLALALKPVALPVVLLLAAVNLRMIPALAAGGVVLVLAPFVHPDPGYVWQQYQAGFGKVLSAANPGADVWFSDIRGMLRDFGWKLTDAQVLPVRGAAALVCLGASVWLGIKTREWARSVLVVLVGVGYILVFSPRTEGVTYAMIGPLAAVLATRELLNREARRVWLGAAMVAYCLVLQFSMVLTGKERKYWLRPLATMVFVVGVGARIASSRARDEK